MGARTQAALADEIRHTETCLAWSNRLGGGSEEPPGPLPAAVAPMLTDDLAAELLVDVFRGGAIGETLAAHSLAARADEHVPGELAEALCDMAADEARHAALAFDTVAWLITLRPELASLLAREQQRFLATASVEERRLLLPLLERLAA